MWIEGRSDDPCNMNTHTCDLDAGLQYRMRLRPVKELEEIHVYGDPHW